MWYGIVALLIFLVGSMIAAIYAAYKVANKTRYINNKFWEDVGGAGMLLFMFSLLWIITLPMAIVCGIMYLIFQFALSFFKEKEKHKSWR